MLQWFLSFNGAIALFTVIIIFGSWFIWDRRFKTKHGKNVPDGFVRTSEISIDPTTKKRLVVYYNEKTGERFYKEE